ncbi:MAG: hypothetical protein QM503_12240 [Bacteroidota bacterium]
MAGVGIDLMSDITPQLNHYFSGLFSYEDREGFPSIESTFEGIKISIDGLKLEGNELAFNLLVTYCFNRSYINNFKKIDWGLVLTIDDIVSTEGLSFTLRDTSKRYKYSSNINYNNNNSNEFSDDEFIEGYIEVPVVILPIFESKFSDIYLSVILHRAISNRVKINVSDDITTILEFT